MKKLEIYIHIPFCIRKCNYCDFLSFSTGDGFEKKQEEYCNALLMEIEQSAALGKDYVIQSIFIGGGTPSVLDPRWIGRILDKVQSRFNVALDAEISMEANPGTLSGEKLEIYKKAGVNRLSIGLQSTDDVCLKTLGRIHSFEEFKENYEMARQLGYTNINIDLMSALPGQTLESYRKTLEVICQMAPEHISSYSLILEEGTPFYGSEDILQMLPDEDTERSMYELTKELLHFYGYERYEISNYAKPGKECIHNLGYWSDVDYLGFGLGASSYYNKARYANTGNMKSYQERPYILPEHRADYHKISLKEAMEEYMYLGLRKTAGVSMGEFERRFHISMEEVYGTVISRYKGMKLLEMNQDVLCLTDQGIDVSNHIFSEFLLDE